MSNQAASRFEVPKKKARIEIIPLIDVIFFLLATFVLFTLSLERIQSIPVDLPIPSNQPIDKNDDDVTLKIGEGRTIFWNDLQMTLEQLPPQIANYKAAVAVPRILITGDANGGTFGTAVEALDMIREAKIDQVSVETTPK